LIKAPILEQLLTDWLTKSLLPPIAHDVTMGNIVTEEKDINHAQYLDFVHYQYGTLYDLITHAPRLSNDPTRHALEVYVDPMAGFITKISPSPAQTSKMNSIQ
jgi:hypothetical protein